MSRILFDARPLNDSGSNARGGVARVTERILACLQETRPADEIVLMTTGWGGGPSFHADPTQQHPDSSPTYRQADVLTSNKPSLHLPLPNKLWSLACMLGITSLDRVASRIAKRSFDELLLPNVGFVGIPRIPYTIVVHDLSFLIEPAWFPWKMRLWHHAVRASRLIQHAAHVWCVSETTARDVQRLLRVDEKRIIVIPPSVVIGSTSEPDETVQMRRSHEPYVLAFGGDNPRKNVATAIAAVARVREDVLFQHLTLTIIGPTSHSPLAAPPSWITILPSVSDAQRNNLYRHASALLYPSWYEGFGLPLHEAARFNVPLLASAHGALPETAPPGVILINPAKPHLWSSALRNILKNSSVEHRNDG